MMQIEDEFLPVSRPYSSERIVSVRGTDGTEGPTTATSDTRTDLEAFYKLECSNSQYN